MRPFTLSIIVIGILGGLCLTLYSSQWPAESGVRTLLLTLGSSVISTGLIGLFLDLTWSRERAKQERRELEPLYDKFQMFADHLGKIEGRLEAFKQLGLNYCHATRSQALSRFLGYAEKLVAGSSQTATRESREVSSRDTVNIVSSSARGLIGYLDRDPQNVQRQWRELIKANHQCFRLLLTHPAYAHLRQPAEERSSGDIELEILKTAVYLHCVAGMNDAQLRFYRGSPTVFTIQAQKNILLNPYPYGKMAMQTLCLEFEVEGDTGYISDFLNMHFNHTWAFMDQPSKVVNGKALVVGVRDFGAILEAFAECTSLTDPLCLRLAPMQVAELDSFAATIGRQDPATKPPHPDPFRRCVEEKGLRYRDWDGCSGCSPRIESGSQPARDRVPVDGR